MTVLEKARFRSFFGLTDKTLLKWSVYKMCRRHLLPPNTALPVCQAAPTYRPKVGFFCFVDVVIQGGKVITRFHFVALASDHVGST